MYEAYPNELQRQLIFSLIQTLWDRAEANGYAQHMTDDPLPNTPPHEVMLHGGLGDHQVAQVAAEVEARTIGAFARTPYVDAGRDSDEQPHYGIPAIPSFPFAGSALVLWDIGPKRTENGETVGTDVPPTTNTPPGEQAGEDPHEFPRRGHPQGARRSPRSFRSAGRSSTSAGRTPATQVPGQALSGAYNGGGSMAERSPAQLYALIFGVVLVAAGIMGFFYEGSFSTGDDAPRDAVLGILDVNGWHNVVHILSGVIGLAVAGSYANARLVRTRLRRDLHRRRDPRLHLRRRGLDLRPGPHQHRGQRPARADRRGRNRRGDGDARGAGADDGGYRSVRSSASELMQ